MNIENLSTLKIHKLTQEQYDRTLAEGNIDPNAIYLTPESSVERVSPHIGANGNWWIGDMDTGVTASGADGYTPVKGKDYFTDTDKDELVAAVLSNFIDVSEEGQ